MTVYIVYVVVCFLCLSSIFKIMYFYCYVYVFLLLCKFCSVYSLFICSYVYCLCVNVYCTTATGCNPIAVNKYIISLGV